MRLTISKKFELSLSYRYHAPDWSEEKNREIFGDRAGTVNGYGGNLNLYTVFDGPVNDKTGMLINVATIKDRMRKLLSERYDHRFLNRDTPPFDAINPTPENISRQILEDAQPLFADESANLTACHLTASAEDEATAYGSSCTERHYWAEFSAARRTYSPNLNDAQNQNVFGMASLPSGHGHHYRLRVTLQGQPDAATGMIANEYNCRDTINMLVEQFDHFNISTDIPEFQTVPNTTEMITRYIYDYLKDKLPVVRVRLWENPCFYCDFSGTGKTVIGIVLSFNAAHRLHSPHLNENTNKSIYGKCNNPAGHGHRYIVETSFDGETDSKTGMLYPLNKVLNQSKAVLADWDYKHLDADTNEFTECPSTGENIIQALWSKFVQRVNFPLYRLRLWETPNNRFTLRR